MIGYAIKQSSASYPLLFMLIDSTDHIAPATGKTPTVTISKNGASFTTPSGTVSEIGSGWYKVAGNGTDAGTLGPLALHATASGADPVDCLFMVVAYDPQSATNLGLSALPTAGAGANGGLPTVDASNGVKLSVGTGTGQVNLSSGKAPATLASTDVTGNVAADVQTIKTQTVTCAAGVTVNVNVGTTQPINFTGTAGSALVKGDAVDWGGTAVGSMPNSTTPPTVAAIATGVWQDLTTGSDFTTVNSIGKLLVTDIDASISSRSTYAGADTSGTTTLLSRLTATRAGLLDHLDADISSRATTAGVWDQATTSHTTAGTFGAAVTSDSSGTTTLLSRLSSTRATGLDHLDADISTRATNAGVWDQATSGHTTAGTFGGETTAAAVWDLPTSGHTTAGTFGEAATSDTAGTTTLLSRLTSTRAGLLDHLDADISTRATAAAVWDLSETGHTTSGTFGAAMNAAGSAGDPLSTPVPGSYGVGTAGYLLGTFLDAAVSSRLATSGYTVPPTTTAIATAIWHDLTSSSDFTTVGSIGKLLVTDIDAAISSRATAAGVWDLATSGHTSAGTFGLAVASLGGGSVIVGGYDTGQDPATLILDAATADHQGSGSVGEAIGLAGAAAASSTDVWDVALPGSYANGKAGYIVGNIVTGVILKDASITSSKFAISTLTGPATGILEKIDQLWRRFFKRSVKSASGTTIKTYADDGVTVLTTQSWSDDGADNETLGAAT